MKKEYTSPEWELINFKLATVTCFFRRRRLTATTTRPMETFNPFTEAAYFAVSVKACLRR